MFDALFGRDRGDDNDVRQESMCQRLCQLPHYLSRIGEEGEQNSLFFRGEGGIARLATESEFMAGRSTTSQSSEESTLMSPLCRKDREEESNLAKFFIQGQQSEESTRVAHEKSLSASNNGSGSYEDEPGRPCFICTTNKCTHFALPCHHSACKVCWSRWLANSKTCMTCAGEVESICRYSLDLVAHDLYELADDPSEDMELRPCITLIEQSLERCIRALLMTKDKISETVESLQTVQAHLVGITKPDPHTTLNMDMLTSILVVERSNLVELLDNFDALFQKDAEWVAMDQEIEALCQSISKVDTILEKSSNQKETGDDQAKGPILAQDDIEAAVLVFESICAQTSIAAQWTHLEGLVAACGPSNHLLPSIVRLFSMIQLPPSGTNGGRSLTTLANNAMSTAAERNAVTEERVRCELLPAAELMLQRLCSLKDSP